MQQGSGEEDVGYQSSSSESESDGMTKAQAAKHKALDRPHCVACSVSRDCRIRSDPELNGLEYSVIFVTISSTGFYDTRL